MIFTAGYDGQFFTPGHLSKMLDDANAVLIDVRLFPKSRIPGWGTKQLQEAIGENRYIQRKDLGGGTNDKTCGIEFLKQFDGVENKNCFLLCKEENPSECHRHYEICVKQDTMGAEHNFPHALHFYRGSFYRAERVTAKMLDNSALVESVINLNDLFWFATEVQTDTAQFYDFLINNKSA